MDDKKELYLTITALLIHIIGIICLLVMEFPTGLFIIVPTAFPHIYRLYILHKREDKR